MKTLIYLVRHGESLGNAAGVILGHTDLDLSELGFKQADTAAEALRDICFDGIYSSDLKRAMSTAAPHAKLRDMSIIPCKGLREMYAGAWEGLNKDEVNREYGDMLARYFGDDFGTFQIPGGESTQGACSRFYDTLFKIASSSIFMPEESEPYSASKCSSCTKKGLDNEYNGALGQRNLNVPINKKERENSPDDVCEINDSDSADGRNFCGNDDKRTILVAAHAAVIRAFWARICGINPERIGTDLEFPTNASYSILEFDGEKFEPIAYSVDNHLAEVGITKL